MVCHRMKQFRTYNGLETWMIAEILGISKEDYELYESGKKQPDIDLIYELAKCYKITVDEFYGTTPRFTLHSKKDDIDELDDVSPALLKMSDLSWEEVQIILYRRKNGSDDAIMKSIIEANFPKDDK